SSGAVFAGHRAREGRILPGTRRLVHGVDVGTHRQYRGTRRFHGFGVVPLAARAHNGSGRYVGGAGRAAAPLTGAFSPLVLYRHPISRSLSVRPPNVLKFGSARPASAALLPPVAYRLRRTTAISVRRYCWAGRCQTMANVFINYRRDESAGIAGRL